MTEGRATPADEPPAPSSASTPVPSEAPASEAPPVVATAVVAQLPPAGPGFELPSARQVVGRGLQLAYESTRDLRGASLYVGLLMAAVAAPFALLLLVDIPVLAEIDFSAPETMTRAQAASLLQLLGGLYGAGVMALLGLVTVQIDGLLIAVATLAGRATGRPLLLREALTRARQVFWRYGSAAFLVGLLSTIATFMVLFVTGAFSGATSTGASILASFVATLVVLPFGYVATAVVIGDVTGTAALRRSIVLVRARPRLAVAVATFAFVASALQTFGLGVAVDLVVGVAEILHPDLDMTGSGLIVAIPLVFIGLMALGSLSITVNAVTTAPQVAAFLGLTHYSGGIDRAREPVAPIAPAAVAVAVAAAAAGEPLDGAEPLAEPDPAMAAEPDPAFDATAEAELSTSPPPIVAPPARPRRQRWISIPMLVLVALEALIVLANLPIGR